MSTRCMVGRMYADGTIRAIRVHYDGYPSGVGKTLLAHYSEANIEELLALGHLSSLGATVPETVAYADYLSDDEESPEEAAEAFQARTYVDDLRYEKALRDGWWDYAYLLCDGEWLFTKGDGYKQLRRELAGTK